MSEFNVSTTNEIMSEEDAALLLQESLYSFSEEASTDHEMLVDSVQFLALGVTTTLTQVAGTAVNAAKEQNDYSVGRTFDFFTDAQLKYGRHVAKVTDDIRKGATVTNAMVATGAYKKSRQQIIINSGLKTDARGRAYVEYMRRNHYVASNVVTGWETRGTKNGAKVMLKLYVNLESQKFFIYDANNKRVPVLLGDPAAYDKVIGKIHASGNVAAYVAALNSMPQDTVEELAENQQLLFLNAYENLVK